MITHTTVADIWRPNNQTQAHIYEITLVICGSLLVALSAQISIGWPIPFTMQTFAVLTLGTLFGAKRAAITMIVYIGEGVVGLPVFSYGQAGGHVLVSPTGGYIIGFVAAAYVTGLLAQKGWDRRIMTTIIAMIIGNIVIYAFGFTWFAIIRNPADAFKYGIYPFIAGDLIKIVLATALLPTGWKLLGKFGLVERS